MLGVGVGLVVSSDEEEGAFADGWRIEQVWRAIYIHQDEAQ